MNRNTLSIEAPELETEVVENAVKEINGAHVGPSAKVRIALQWSNVLLSAAAENGILKAQCLAQIKENEEALKG